MVTAVAGYDCGGRAMSEEQWRKTVIASFSRLALARRELGAIELLQGRLQERLQAATREMDGAQAELARLLAETNPAFREAWHQHEQDRLRDIGRSL